MSKDDPAVLNYLSSHHPFDLLPEEELRSASTRAEFVRIAEGDVVLERGARTEWFYLVHQGAVEVLDAQRRLLAKLGEGDAFGHRSLLGDGIADDTFRAIEPAALLRLPAGEFRRLCRHYVQFEYYFRPALPNRQGVASGKVGSDGSGVNLLTVPVSEIIFREPVTMPSYATVRETAGEMTRLGVSSILVMDGDRLSGIVTDRDLRSRVVAHGRSSDTALRDIMTPSPATISDREVTHRALFMMAKLGIHHLPVMRGNTVVGMVTDTDLVKRYSASPVHVVGEIHRCDDLECLVGASERLPQLLVALMDANASSQSTGQIVSSIGEAISSRLLQLAEAKMGPPPVPYAWLSGGSLARFEQTAHSDQDNCLLLSDAYDAGEHCGYFEELARFVCEGLNACGYVYCPGEVMAMTATWRQPLRVWKGYFRKWIDEPEPKALMHASIFFDLRCLHGDHALFADLKEFVTEKARSNKLFHAFMASNSLQHQPPLGFFRNFVLVKDGEHDRTLDLKHSGVVPIIDIARIHALAQGVRAVNTFERLESAGEHGAISRQGAADLLDSLEFIGTIRLRHQARQIRAGKAPDNFVAPARLSQFDRIHLKDAFAAVRTIQAALAQRYQTGRFR